MLMKTAIKASTKHLLKMLDAVRTVLDNGEHWVRGTCEGGAHIDSSDPWIYHNSQYCMLGAIRLVHDQVPYNGSSIYLTNDDPELARKLASFLHLSNKVNVCQGAITTFNDEAKDYAEIDAMFNEFEQYLIERDIND